MPVQPPSPEELRRLARAFDIERTDAEVTAFAQPAGADGATGGNA